MPNYEPDLITLEIGLAGIHGETPRGASVTIYDTRLKAYFGDLVEGGFVIDKSQALDHQPHLAVKSPMCKGNLPPGTTDKFPGAEGSLVANVLANEPGNGFCGLARLMLLAPDCGSFDFVAPDVYAAWWKRHGARIGQRHGNRIIWDNGQEEEIPPFETRYQD